MASDWLYRKLYTGRVPNALDHLVLELLPRVAAIRDVDRWFFIRFDDQDGPHMRLRLRAQPDRARELDDLCESALQALARARPSRYRPTISWCTTEVPGRQPVIRLASDQYVPEQEKFGVLGMAFAEALFQRSSEVAVELLDHERRGLYSRKNVVLSMMATAQHVFVPDASRSAFWFRVSDYWLHRCGVDVVAWRSRFVRKASALRAQAFAYHPGTTDLPRCAVELLGRWRAALEDCAASYRSAPDQGIPPAVLAANFAHLMNNRIGLLPIEDAYYAALLSAAEPS